MKRYVTKLVIPAMLLYVFLTGVLLIYNDYSVSALMPLAPIAYGVMFCVLYMRRNIVFESFVVNIILALWFLRLVVGPCIYILSGYASNVMTSVGTDNLNFAVLLVVYEFFVTTLFLLSNKKINSIAVADSQKSQNVHPKTKQVVTWIVVVLFILAVLAVLLDRSVLATISTIFSKISVDASSDVERRRELLRLQSETSLAYHLFSNCVYYLQILIPAIVLASVMSQRRLGERHNKGYWLSIIIAVLAVLITTDNNSTSVCIMLAVLLVVLNSYHEKMEKQLPIIVMGVGLFITIFLFAKVGFQLNVESSLSEISRLLNAYFAGLPNISAGLSVEYENKLATFFGDIVSGIPYAMAIFKGSPQSVTLFNEAVYGFAGIKNQIMPLIATGYHYLGIFAPAFTIVIYSIAISMENRMKKSQLVLNQVIYAVIAVNFAIGPCLYGLSSLIKRLCLFIPLLILARINIRRLSTGNEHDNTLG